MNGFWDLQGSTFGKETCADLSSNHMNTSVINDFLLMIYYGWYLKIVSKSPVGAFRRVHSNITSRAFIQVPINYMTEEIANTRVLICSAVQIKTNDQLASSLSQS